MKTPECHILCNPTPCDYANNAQMSNENARNLTEPYNGHCENLTEPYSEKIKPYRALHRTSDRLWSP